MAVDPLCALCKNEEMPEKDLVKIIMLVYGLLLLIILGMCLINELHIHLYFLRLYQAVVRGFSACCKSKPLIDEESSSGTMGDAPKTATISIAEESIV